MNSSTKSRAEERGSAQCLSPGHYYFQRRNLEDYRKAVGYFDQAIRLDPKYALAYTERSEAWTLIGDLTGQGTTRVVESAERCGKSRRDRS